MSSGVLRREGEWVVTGWLRCYVAHLREHIRHHFLASLGLASLVALTEPLWVSLDDWLQVYSHQAAAFAVAHGNGPAPFKRVAIVKIDENRFADSNRYAGTSPLSRCRLADDMTAVLRNTNIRLLAVGLDLSPTERGEYHDPRLEDNTGQLETLDPVQGERECQCKLDAVLLAPDNAPRLILMEPAEGSDSIKKQVELWRNRMQAAGVVFADTSLHLTRGLVRKLFVDNDKPPRGGGSEQVPVANIPPPRNVDCGKRDDRAKERARAPVVAWSVSRPFADVVHERIRLNEAMQTHNARRGDFRPEGPPARERPIAFQALVGLYARGETVVMGTGCLSPWAGPCGFDTVLLGAGYSADDVFETPHGQLNSVDIHAASAACPARTEAQARVEHAVKFILKVALGTLVFAPMIHFHWGRYFFVRSGRRQAEAMRSGSQPLVRVSDRLVQWLRPVRPGDAYVWWLLLLFTLTLSCLALAVAVPWLSSLCSVFALPTAFVLGLIVEGAVAGSVAAASHQHAAPAAAEPRLSAPPSATIRWPLWRQLPTQLAESVAAWGPYRVVFWIAVATLVVFAVGHLND